MEYLKKSIMKKTYPLVRNGKEMIFMDLSLLDQLNGKEDPRFTRILDDGYGKTGTLCHLKTAIRERIGIYPKDIEILNVSFEDPFRTFCMDMMSTKTSVFEPVTGKQVYVFVKPYAYRVKVYSGHIYGSNLCYLETVGRWTQYVDTREALLGDAV